MARFMEKGRSLLTWVKDRRKKERGGAARHVRIVCNLCGHVFRAPSRFLRFCKTCREEDEMLRFSEWLGTTGR